MDKKKDDSAPTVSATEWAEHEIRLLKKALVYVAFALHGTPKNMLAEGIVLIDGDRVRVKREGWTVDTGAPTPPTSAADAERLDALAGFEGKNQWIVAKGFDSFTVCLKPRHHATRRTLREAIDAAIAASKETT